MRTVWKWTEDRHRSTFRIPIQLARARNYQNREGSRLREEVVVKEVDDGIFDLSETGVAVENLVL